jgi:hypothetical protein
MNNLAPRPNPRPPPRKLSRFDIRSIPKKPPAPSLTRRRRTKADAIRVPKGATKVE